MNEQYISLSEQVAKKISNMIFVEKKYKQNQRLPSEAELAKELNVSRTSLREAVKILISNKILYIKRGVGTFVSGDVSPTINPFDIFYSNSKKQMVKDAFEIRLLLEVEAAKLAAIRATEEDIREIEIAENECTKRIEAGLDFNNEDQKFHTAIAKATQNLILNQISPLLQVSIFAALDTYSNYKAYSNYKDAGAKLESNALYYHKEIARFIKERDPDGAGFAMYCHISKTVEAVNNPIIFNEHSELQETAKEKTESLTKETSPQNES